MIEQDLNNRFEKAMFNILRCFNFIDHNVGLLIASTPSIQSRSEILERLSKITFNQRLSWLKSLLKDSALAKHVGDKGVIDFNKWLLDAQKARKLRNRYVHAIWRFNPSIHGSPVSISSPTWMTSVPGHVMVENLSLDQLEAKAVFVEGVFKSLCLLRKQFGI